MAKALLPIVWAGYSMAPLVRRLVGPRVINLLLIDDDGPALDLPDCHRIDAARLEVGGPALFRQRRVGRNNQFFDTCKFRTMRAAQSDRAC